MTNDPDRRRTERLQVMLEAVELRAIDVWRFRNAMPSRAAAIRELIRRGLSVTDDPHALAASQNGVGTGKSTDYGVIDIEDPKAPSKGTPEGPAERDG